MKAKDLAKILEEYPDFEVVLHVLDPNSCTVDNPWPSYIHYDIEGLDDIAHSAKELHFGLTSLN